MRLLGAEVLVAVPGDDCGLSQGTEHLNREEFVAEFAVEGFHGRVLP